MLLRAVRAVLRPLARLLIAEQIPFSAISEAIKAVLVEEAQRSFQLPGKRLSDSRVTLLTGVHRKDVKRLRSGGEDDGEVAWRISLGARLVADWNALPEFLDSDGRPLPLYRSSAPARPSVRDLAETAGQDIRPQAVVDEWLRLGVVEVDDQNRIHLKQAAFVPESDFEAKAEFLGAQPRRARRRERAQPVREGCAQLDQGLYYGRLTPASVVQLDPRARARRERAAHPQQRGLRQQQRDEGRHDADERVHFGVYFERDPARATPTTSSRESDVDPRRGLRARKVVAGCASGPAGARRAARVPRCGRRAARLHREPDPDHGGPAPEATAVAVEAGRIVALGSLPEVEQALGRRGLRARRHLAEYVLVPGFVEPHLHPSLAATILPMEIVSAMEWETPRGARARCGERRRSSRGCASSTPSASPRLAAGLGLPPPLPRRALARAARPGLPRAARSSCGSARCTRCSSTALRSKSSASRRRTSAHPQADWEAGHLWEAGLFALGEPALAVLAAPRPLAAGSRC